MSLISQVLDSRNPKIVHYSSILLLILVVITIFFIPLMPVVIHSRSYNILYSLIFFVSVTSLHSKRRMMIVIAIIAFITEWIAESNETPILLFISKAVNIVFFIIVVVKMIVQIAGYKRVNLVVIVESITGYLLMGLMFSILVILIIVAEPGAYSFSTMGGPTVTDINYFTFVTMTTLGYGDYLPILPVSKSLTLLITICGQLYLTIIVATLVGKFLNQRPAPQE